jgi:hypothetical protein
MLSLLVGVLLLAGIIAMTLTSYASKRMAIGGLVFAAFVVSAVQFGPGLWQKMWDSVPTPAAVQPAAFTVVPTPTVNQPQQVASVPDVQVPPQSVVPTSATTPTKDEDTDIVSSILSSLGSWWDRHVETIIGIGLLLALTLLVLWKHPRSKAAIMGWWSSRKKTKTTASGITVVKTSHGFSRRKRIGTALVFLAVMYVILYYGWPDAIDTSGPWWSRQETHMQAILGLLGLLLACLYVFTEHPIRRFFRIGAGIVGVIVVILAIKTATAPGDWFWTSGSKGEEVVQVTSGQIFTVDTTWKTYQFADTATPDFKFGMDGMAWFQTMNDGKPVMQETEYSPTRSYPKCGIANQMRIRAVTGHASSGTISVKIECPP